MKLPVANPKSPSLGDKQKMSIDVKEKSKSIDYCAKDYCEDSEDDEELLIHSFQESLTGVAITWYTNLEPSRVHSWKDLMVAFVRHCQYNSDMALDRMQL